MSFRKGSDTGRGSEKLRGASLQVELRMERSKQMRETLSRQMVNMQQHMGMATQRRVEREPGVQGTH